jgi:hypothetical protein
MSRGAKKFVAVKKPARSNLMLFDHTPEARYQKIPAKIQQPRFRFPAVFLFSASSLRNSRDPTLSGLYQFVGVQADFGSRDGSAEPLVGGKTR